jgi:Ca2+-binding RTX toxin-like protein
MPGLVGALSSAAATLVPVPAVAAVPTCFGVPATIVGTSGPDHLEGSDEVSDVIYGGGGNDWVSGGPYEFRTAAPDLLCGGPGNDGVYGAAGADRLNGGDGDDRVEGLNGPDVMQGNAGDDFVEDESNIDADRADDVLRGGPGEDVLVNAGGQDRVYGQGGNDRLFDEECGGPTLLSGGWGNDHLESFVLSIEGMLCAEIYLPLIGDRVNGGLGTDTATTDEPDTVWNVEALTHEP